MTTSKLYVDPAQVAEAEENDFAKFVVSVVHATYRSLSGPARRQRLRKNREPLLCERCQFHCLRFQMLYAHAGIQGFMRDGQLLEKQEVDKM